MTAPTVYRASTRVFCPKCGEYVRVELGTKPSPEAYGLPAEQLPEAMYSALCRCGTGITIAVSQFDEKADDA